MADRKAMWLATLGYFVAVELIGRTIRKPETAFEVAERVVVLQDWLLEFADEPILPRGREVLSALRLRLRASLPTTGGGQTLRPLAGTAHCGRRPQPRPEALIGSTFLRWAQTWRR
jgi:hypothetical protein